MLVNLALSIQTYSFVLLCFGKGTACIGNRNIGYTPIF